MYIIKRMVLTLIVLMIMQFAHAQSLYKGKVIDSITRQPIEYAIINSLTKSTITDRFGNFELSLPADSANIKVLFVGYRSQKINLTSGAKRTIVELARGVMDLKEVIISPHLNNASFHTISGIDLNLHPVNSSQELLRLVPGLFIAQHMGGGKAEQIFMRGFDADHGTDVNISVDGLPVNMVSHAHGQGYADMHFLIPETVEHYDFGKGPYYSNYGDFTTAGYVSYTTKDVPDKSMLQVEAGRFNTYRVMGMISLLSDKARLNGQNAYVAGEYNYTDGPFQLAEHYKRLNLFGKYNVMLGADNKLSISASTFSTSWRASGEIPRRLIEDGTLNRFATVDSLQGGNSDRTNATVKLTSDLRNFTLENQLYYSRYNFLLHVNSTFFAEDSINGDAVRQIESRNLFGYNGKLTHRRAWANSALTSVAGIGTRIDRVYNSELSHTIDQNTVLQYDQLGNISESNINGFIDESLESGKWLFNIGSRIDYLNFSYDDRLNPQLASRSTVVVSPKVNVQFTPSDKLQFFVKAGKGFHSNDARAVIFNNGLQTLPAAYGTDLGLTWKPAEHLYINAALWYLYLQQEFVYTDDGGVAPGGKTQREGIDLSARYQLTNWLFANLNVNLAKPRLVDSAKGNNYLPLAPTFTSTGGLDFKFTNGINGGISYRYMYKRPGNNDYSLVANGYYFTDMTVNYTRHRYEFGVAIENLFNTKWDEYSVEEETKLRNEAAPVDGMSITPGTPFFLKLKLAVFF